MNSAQIDYSIDGHGALKLHSAVADEYHVSRGDFIVSVQPHAGKYSFCVRDTRRQRPTIHGFGVDFAHAVSIVTALLDALTVNC